MLHNVDKKWLKIGMFILSLGVGLFVFIANGSAATLPDNNDYTASTGTVRSSGVSDTGTSISTESPVDIKISDGDFTLNYVDKTGYVSPDGSTNKSGVSSLTDSSGNIKLNDNQLMSNGNQAYTGGFLQARGKISIRAVLAKTDGGNLVSNMSSGNYGVMVRVEMPEDVDASAMAKSIVWDQAFMMLQISVPIAGSPQFPMQFDHHVYLDPDDPHAFFLKVKGIPLEHSERYLFPSNRSTIKLARFAQDGQDFKNNVSDNGDSITPTELGTSAAGSVDAGGSIMSSWYFLPPVYGPVALNGTIGYSLALLQNANTFSWLIGSGFDGTANINFYIDIAKYNGNLADSSPNKQLTKGKLMPSPRADGKINLGLKMYGSSQLVDPFSINSSGTNFTFDPGKSPVDYALVKKDQVSSGTNVPVTSTVKSWNAYASPWDTRSTNKLNTTTSSWESVDGQKTELPNVSQTDSLVDRLAKLDIKLDGLMVNAGKGTDAAGTDYSGSQNGTVGAVGANRFARVANYFDTSKLDSNGEGALSSAKLSVDKSKLNLAPLYKTAGTAGKVSLATDASSTLPNTSTAAGQYVYYGGKSTLPNGDTAQILPAPMFYTQGTIPAPTTKFDESTVTIYTSQLASSKTVTVSGSWVDDYANQDSVSVKDSVTGNSANAGTNLTAASSKNFALKLSSGSVSGALNLGTGSSLLGTHTLTATITQPNVKLSNGQTVTTGKTGTASMTVKVVDDSQVANVSMTKAALSNGKTVTNLAVKNATSSAAGETVTLQSKLTNDGTTAITTPVIQSDLGANLGYKGNLSVLVNGVAITTANATTSGNTLSIALGQTLKAKDQVTVQYQVQVTSPLPTTGVTLSDLLMSGSVLKAKSNAVTLTPIVSGSLSLTSVPGPLEFGDHDLPTGGATYGNQGTGTQLTVVDGLTSGNGWTVSAALTPFASGSAQFSSAGIKFDTGLNQVNADNTNVAIATQANDSTGYWTKAYPNIKMVLSSGVYGAKRYQATMTYTLAANVNPT
ncbi:autotransporter outer membrane beta-barrel domain-containing protein [Secundilactobacillus malefermentans]|uniref:hypothetical protein n=1 Tax=Secundilactobacillus malefermentans TaxID=176292 RepID=UPI0011C6ECE4|nr:hypothetical protein [Secundilactobacillus malefermentans]QEA31132.1 hypothetical protein FGL90_02540 [Secundilactobacillus malefermentans]